MMRYPKVVPAQAKKSLVQQRPDPLEHTRYGEGNTPSSHDLPIPNKLEKPLVITNVKDEHDFTPPYKDHRPPKVFDREIHLASKSLAQHKDEEEKEGPPFAGANYVN